VDVPLGAKRIRVVAVVEQPSQGVDLQVAVTMEIQILAPAEDNQEERDKGASIQRPWFDIQMVLRSVNRTPATVIRQR
jgi:hypothetical protein